MKKLNLGKLAWPGPVLLLLIMLAPAWCIAQNFNLKYKHLEQAKNLSFTENKGQLKNEKGEKLNGIKYYAHAKGMNIYLQDNKMQFVFEKGDGLKKQSQNIKDRALHKNRPVPTAREAARIELELLGSNTNPVMVSQKPGASKLNFYTGANNKEVTDVNSYEKITYKNIYKNIDFDVEGQNGKLEYSFVVHPGANISDIRMRWNGVNETENIDGRLKYKCALGEITESDPYSFTANGQVVASSFNRHNNVTGFIAAAYNKNEVLIIDPTLSWATYFGGDDYDFSYGTAADKKGNVYMTGSTSSTTAIATSGAFQTALGGSSFLDDIFLTKFNVNGNLVWSTYFGSDSGEYAYGLTISNDNIYIGGTTTSPTGIATSGSYQTKLSAGVDAILIRFAPSGKLKWATYYGGNGDDNLQNITSDNNGGIYITGYTSSTGLVGKTAYQSKLGSTQDAFIAKFDTTSKLSWSSYYGGDDDDYAVDVKTDANANVYITGFTASSTGIASSGAFQTSSKGSVESFLAKFSSSGALSWSTYFGGNNDDYVFSAATYGSSVYICGATNSTSGLATSGANQTAFAGNSDAFVAQFTSAGAIGWATYFGKTGDDAFSLAIGDGNGNVYLAGNTSSAAMATAGTFQTSFAGVLDGLVTKFSSAGKLIWSSYLGGDDEDNVYGISVDDSSRLFISGYTVSTNKLATSGAFQTDNGGFYDAFLAEINDCSLSASVFGNITVCKNTNVVYRATKNTNALYKWVVSGGNIVGANNRDSVIVNWTSPGSAKVTVTETYLVCSYVAFQNVTVNDAPVATFLSAGACLGDTVAFTNNSVQAIAYFWQFGDGDTSYSKSPLHKYKQANTYHVLLAIKSINGCVDSFKKQIKINPKPKGHWGATVSGLNANFLANDSLQSSYVWDFGDGKGSGGFRVKHTYTAKGTYKVRLTVIASSGCSALFDSSITVTSSSAILLANEEKYNLEMYPNPFNNAIHISYLLPETGKVKMELMDITGRTIAINNEEILQAGVHTHSFNTAMLKAGSYLIKININGQSITRQVMKL